jgi:hypothetical protein
MNPRISILLRPRRIGVQSPFRLPTHSFSGCGAAVWGHVGEGTGH